jgi:hypothetical protein
MKSVRISNELYAAAEAASKIMHRSIAMQLEHWASLGQTIEAQHISDMKQLAVGEDLALRAAKVGSQQDFARSVARGDVSNRAGMFFSKAFFKDVSVDTGRQVL